jgi:hypothetical protein
MENDIKYNEIFTKTKVIHESHLHFLGKRYEILIRYDFQFKRSAGSEFFAEAAKFYYFKLNKPTTRELYCCGLNLLLYRDYCSYTH